jgi:hypothetical protein
MKKILLLIFMFAPIVFYGQTYIDAGPVSGELNQQGSPYLIMGDIYVPESENLVISAGVKMLFDGWYKFEVFGSLTAVGTNSSNIIFTTSREGFPWRGIRFIENTGSSHLDYCEIKYTESAMDPHLAPDAYGGGILCYNSRNASILVSNSKIHHNTAYYGGGVMVYGSSLALENCDIRYNEAVTGGGGVVIMNNSVVSLVKNTITLNDASKGGGLFVQNSLNDRVECNFIVNNSAEYGAGIYMNGSNTSFCKNTIARNMASEDGGGIYFYNNANPDLNSCIVYYNEDGVKEDGEQIYLANDFNDPSFYYCNIMGGKEGFSGPGAGTNYTGIYLYCVDGDPLFKNMYNGNYSLTWANYPYDDNTKSACIDKGCPGEDPDPDKSCCDIGACCYFQVLDVPDNLHGESVLPQAFIAGWNDAYGALGYEFDVAHDRYFENMIYENMQTPYNKVYVHIPEPADMLWFRVRSYNTGLKSDDSQSWALVWVSLDENQAETPEIYASTDALHINIPQATANDGQVWIYNTSGQLLGQYSLVSGTNAIRMGISRQIVIVKVLLNNKVYQQKLLMH